jgi:hypothetical protein
MGTKGEVYGDAGETTVDLYSFATRQHEIISTEATTTGDTIVSGHGGGDPGIVDALYKYLTDEISEEGLSEIGISVDNHMIAFAAEESRLTGKVVEMEEYLNRF